MALFAWLAVAELYAIWESRKQIITNREITYSNLTKKFDRALKAVQEESDPEIKALMLNDLQDRLRDLCYNYEWNRVKGEVEKVLDYTIIPEKLFDDSNAKRYVQFLAMIVNRFGEQVIDIISKKWLKELDKFYNDPNYASSLSNLLYILLQLRKYSRDYIMKLVDDAATRWTELEFQTLGSDLGAAFDELKKRDESAHEEIISYLRRKMRDAKQNEEKVAYGRLLTIFNMANK